MNFPELAKHRYTTKRYDATKKIADDKIRQLQEVLHLSPSSINSQPWRFYFISQEETKNALAGVSYFNEQKIRDASHLVVFTVIDRIEYFEAQMRSHLPEGAIGYYNNFIKPLPESEIRSWLQHQVYLALGFFLSACAGLGIDSTPMEGVQGAEYDRILQLKSYKTLFAVAIGYRDTEDPNRPAVKPKSRLPFDHTIISI